jgi:hypothetical protein
MSRSRSLGVRRTIVAVVTLALGALTTPVIDVALASAAQAADCTPSATDPCLTGSGTTADPYRIGTWQDLDAARAAVNADTAHTGLAAARYVLAGDVDYSEDTDTAGKWGGFDYFTGVFDGAGHTVADITYIADTAALNPTAMGFFRVVNQATVKNLTLRGVTASGTYEIGGLSAYAYASTITGNSVIGATITSTVPNGGLGVGGLVGMAYGTTQPTGTAVGETISNNRVVNTSLTDADNLGGLVQYAVGGVVIEKNYVSATLKNNITTGPAHSKAAGEVLGYVGGGTATVVRNNVVGGGSITYAGTSTTTSRTGFVGYVIGDTANSAYTESNDLVLDTVTISATTGGFTGGASTPSGKGSTDGIVVRPATLAQQATYTGTSSQTDGAVAYKQVGWNLGATVNGTNVLSAWRWDATTNAPVVADAPKVSFAHHLYFQPSQTAPDALAVARATATIDHGTLTGIDAGDADWATVGTYDATVTAEDQGFTTVAPATVQVVPASRLLVAGPAISLPSTQPVTDAAILAAAGPSMDDGHGGSVDGTFAVSDSTVQGGTAGRYAATITGTDEYGFTTDPVTIVVDVVDSGIKLANPTLYFEPTATAPTAQQLLDALGASALGGDDDSLGIDPDSLAAVDFDTVGDYTLTVTDTADGLPSATATIHVVPVPVITTSSTTMNVLVGATVTSADVLDQTGAQLTDGDGHPLEGELSVDGVADVDTTKAGSTPVTITGTGTAGGFTAEPVTVTVEVSVAAPVVNVANPTIFVSTHGTAPTEHEILDDLGAQIDHGTLSVDLGTTDFQTPGTYPINVIGSDDGASSTTVPATLVVTALRGAGTAARPLQIGSRADLDGATAQLNANTTGYRTAHYVLSTDIDYDGDEFTGIDYFMGVFDGAGHTVSDITYVADTATVNPSTLGFFRVIDQATVKNLTLSRVVAQGTNITAGLVGFAYASEVTGCSVLNSALSSTFTGGGGGVAGLVGQAWENSLAHPSASLGGTVSNNRVANTTVIGAGTVAGLVEYAVGSEVISDNYVSAALTNVSAGAPLHSKAAGEIVGYLGGSATHNIVTLANNVVGPGSSIVYTNTPAGSYPRTKFAGYVLGDVQNGGYTESNDLVSSTMSITATNATFTGAGPAAPAGGGNADGTVVSPATLADRATYDGSATGQTDGAVTYDQLGWAVGGTVDGTDVVSAWRWDATTSTPRVAAAPVISSDEPLFFQTSATAPSPAAVVELAQAGGAIDHGSVTAVDTDQVDWATAGSYDATITAEAQGFTTVAPATVQVVPVSRLLVAGPAISLSSAEPVTDAAILEAAGPSMDDGHGASVDGTFEVTDSTVQSGTAGQYAATITGTDEYGFTTDPMTIEVDVVDPVTAEIVLANPTLYYVPTATAPTVQQLLDALGASAVGGDDDHLGIDPDSLATVDFDTVGDYTLTVTDTADAAPSVTATIHVVPVPVITTTTTTLTVPVGGTLTDTSVLTSTGAQLTDGDGHSLAGLLAVDGVADVDTTKPGSDEVTITGTGTAGGFTADPVTVTIRVVWTSAPVVTLRSSTILVSTHATAPSDQEILDDLGAQIDHGTLSVDLGTTDFQSPGSYAISVIGSDDGVPSTTVPATLVVTPVGGSGTASDPYQINDWQGLDATRAAINADTAHTGAAAAHYVLTGDVDYSEDTDTAGKWGGFDYFTGVFDGAGHTVADITYIADTAALNPTAMGFFRVVNQATVKNLTLRGVTASGTYEIGGLTAYAYASTITGNSVVGATLTSTVPNGGLGVGGLVGMAYGTTQPTSAAVGETISNNRVVDATLTDTDNLGGLVEYAANGVVIEKNYVSATLKNNTTTGPAHSRAAGEVLGYNGGGTSNTVRNNVVGGGSIIFAGTSTTTSRTGFIGYVIGDTANSGYTESNDLVANTVTISATSGTLTGGASTPAGKGSTDGIVVSPATLAQQATYTGTASQTDGAATYKQLGWNVGATVNGTNVLSAWRWDAASGTPMVADAPDASFADNLRFHQSATAPSPADARAAAQARATIDHGSVTGIDTRQVDWDTVGTYDATVTVGDQGFTTTVPVTIEVVEATQLVVANATIFLPKSQPVTDAAILAAAGPSMDDGHGGSVDGTFAVSDSTVQSGTAGRYAATITGTDEYGFTTDPVTIEVDIVDVAIVLANPTLYFEPTVTAPSVQQLLDALGASAVGGDDDHLAIDPDSLAAVDFDTVGDYTLTVTDAADGAPPASATIHVVPVPVITTSTTTMTLSVGSTLTAADVLDQTDAQLTDGDGHPLAGQLAVEGLAGVDTTKSGSYEVTVTGTETAGGFTADPVTVTVKVRWTTAPMVGLTSSTVFFSTHRAAPTDEEVLDALGAKTDHGTLTLDLGTTNFGLAGAYTVSVTGSDDEVPSTTVPATVVVTLLDGAGTAADPLQIGSRADLDTAADQLNQLTPGYRTAHYVLTVDVNYDGDRFAGIDYFSGVWDGAGHTISNITYTSDNAALHGTALGLFRVIDQATIKNLSINNAIAQGTENTGGLVAYAYASTVTHCSVLNSTINTGYGGGGGGVGGLIGQAWEASLANPSAPVGTTVSNNLVLNTSLTHNDNSGGLVEYAVGKVVISNNYVSTDAYNTTTGGLVHSKGAGGVLGYVGGGGSTTVAVRNNVVGGGSITYNIVPSTSSQRTGWAGYVLGDVQNTSWTESGDLVSSAVTIGARTGTITGGPSTPSGRGSTDGTVVSPAALASQATYTQLGWDFGAGGSPGAWTWDSAAARPRLAGVPELVLPTVTIAKDAQLYVAGAVPSDAQVLADLGAAMSPQGTLALNWQGAVFQLPGTYKVKVEGLLDGNAGFPQVVTITVVPRAVVSTALTGIEYVAGSTVSEQQLLTDVGAFLSADGSLSADLSVVDFATPGTYSVTISGTDQYDIDATPATVDVVIVAGAVVVPGDPPPAELIGTPQVGQPLRVDPASVSTISDPTYQWLRSGDAIAGASAATYVPTADDAGQLLQVVVTSGSDPSLTTTSAPVTVAAGTFQAGLPSVTGPGRVGTTLGAAAGSWDPAPTAVAYQWTRDGDPIAGATNASYQLAPADLGRSVGVQVVVVRPGYTSARAASTGTPVSAGTLKAGKKPTVKGEPKVHGLLRATAGTWSPAPRIQFQWFAGTKRIKGATKATYRITPQQRHKHLRVRVTATLTGYRTAVAYSAATKAVR